MAVPDVGVRIVALGLVTLALLAARAGAANDEVPDAQLLLDLDLLSQAAPDERDLMRRLSLVERLRMLEVFRLLDARPPSPPERGAPAGTGPR
jgi:hypothetical protein